MQHIPQTESCTEDGKYIINSIIASTDKNGIWIHTRINIGYWMDNYTLVLEKIYCYS